MPAKTIKASVACYDRQMFLRLNVGGKTIDIPMDKAALMMERLNIIVPYKYGDMVNYQPVTICNSYNVIN